jgi:hypothetical protein
MLSTVHAGGEQGWKSGHLEPFSFLGHASMSAPLFIFPEIPHPRSKCDSVMISLELEDI